MLRDLLFVLPVLLATAMPAGAQAPLSTSAFELLKVRDAAAPDSGAIETLSAIRAAVSAKDEARLAALLAPDFVALSCEADPTAPCAPGKTKAVRAKGASLERLRLALCCGGRDDPAVAPDARTEALFGVLGSLLENGVAARAPDVADDVCQPALPAFDKQKTKALAKRLDIDPSTMRVAASPIEARSRPERTVAVIATFPQGAIVPLLTTLATPVPAGWTALALPSGGIGFAEGVTLGELAPEAVCVRKSKHGWRLAVLVGRQS